MTNSPGEPDDILAAYLDKTQPDEESPPENAEKQQADPAPAEAREEIIHTRLDPRVSQPPPEDHLAYRGDLGELYKLWFIYIGMSIVTLGIYRFWGKTRMRKYVAECFELAGDEFEYLGSGKQMFFGALKVWPIIALLAVPFMIAPFLGPVLGVILCIFSAAAFIYLFPVALFMALRYRLSHVSWRGIRGYMAGSALEYGAKAMGWNLMNVLTLGLMKPKFDMAKATYKLSHMYAGNIRATFKGDAQNLMKAHWQAWGFSAYALIVAGLTFAIPIVMQSKGQEIGAGFIALPFLGMGAFILAVICARYYYLTAFWNECINNFSIGQVTLKTSITFGKLFKFSAGNLAIRIFMFGFGKPMIVQRKMNFIANNIHVYGDLNAQEILQAKDQKPSFAEGFEDALDLDSGLMG